jgi:hypothetical protein
LEVAYSQLHAPDQRCVTQGLQPRSCSFISRGLSPSTAGRSRPFRFQLRGSSRALQHHIPQRFPSRVQFGLFPFRSPLIRESQLISSPPPTWMLPFGGFPLPYGSSPGITRGGKSHSEISGSKAACAYPELIAACHVLRQRPSRAIRQAAYHAEPFRNPHSIRVNSEVSSTQHLIADPHLFRVSLSPSSPSRAVLRAARLIGP